MFFQELELNTCFMKCVTDIQKLFPQKEVLLSAPGYQAQASSKVRKYSQNSLAS